MNEREGVDRFSIVTAGKALTGEEFDKAIHAYETMKESVRLIYVHQWAFFQQSSFTDCTRQVSAAITTI